MLETCWVLVAQEGHHGGQTLLLSLARCDHIVRTCLHLKNYLLFTALPLIILILHIAVKERKPLVLRPASPNIISYPKI